MSEKIYGIDNWQINIGIVGLDLDRAMSSAMSLSENRDLIQIVRNTKSDQILCVAYKGRMYDLVERKRKGGE